MLMFAKKNLQSYFLGILAFSLCSCGLNDNPQLDPLIKKQKNDVLREAMQRVQIGAEHYAADHGTDKYPTQMDDEFKSYLPGGREGLLPAPLGVANVFTGANEFPKIGSYKDIHALRFGPRFDIKPGEISYSPIENGKGYIIVAGAADGKALLDDLNPGQVLVFSNFDE